MKMKLAALACACLFAAPIVTNPPPAMAQSRGGGFHGAGGFHGGGFHGGGFHGGGFHGGGPGRSDSGGRGFGDGARQDRFRHDRFRDVALFDFGFGGYFDPWLYGDPGFYGFLDYDDGYGSPYPDDASYPPPSGPADWSGPPPSWQYQPPLKDQVAPAQSCGSWVWDRDQSSYKWTVC